MSAFSIGYKNKDTWKFIVLPTGAGCPVIKLTPLFHNSKEASEALVKLQSKSNDYNDCVVLFFNRDESVWEAI